MSLAHTGLGSGNLSSMESEGMESKYHYRVRVCVYTMIYYVCIYILDGIYVRVVRKFLVLIYEGKDGHRRPDF